jgi:hypothetical protein
MHTFTRYQPPTKQKVLERQLSERLRRTIDACNKLSEGTQEYVFNRTTDRQELELSIYKQKFSDNWFTSLKTLSRVKLKPGMFVKNEENDTDQDFKVKEALVYSVDERVMNPKNPTTEVLSYCLTKMGTFQSPRVILERDELGNVNHSEVIGWSNMFYIPWDNGKSARKVIQEFDGAYRNTVLAIANASGDSWHTGNTYNIPNLQEWLEADFEDLLEANRGNFLKNEFGGTVLYEKDKLEKQKKLKAEVDEFRRTDKTRS